MEKLAGEQDPWGCRKEGGSEEAGVVFMTLPRGCDERCTDQSQEDRQDAGENEECDGEVAESGGEMGEEDAFEQEAGQRDPGDTDEGDLECPQSGKQKERNACGRDQTEAQ
ncbi:MAG: hypothetical protein ACYTGC_13190 [Planctomycetota bacterium]|jgi:hypothetical protein